MSTDNRVRLLLDIDGVINAVGAEPGDHWPEWSRAVCRGFRITYAPGLGEWLCGLSARGVEVVWLTTWGAFANEWISPLLGLPQLSVVGEPFEHDGPGWWKLPLAQRLWEQDGRPFIWIDDDLIYDTDAVAWLGGLPRGQFLAVCPKTERGLEPRQIEAIERWLAEVA